MSLVFDDFLGLAARDFSRHRVVAFVGESGSGKSTAIGFLRARYPAMAVIDEARAADLPRLCRMVAAGRAVLVASHLPAWLLRLALPAGRVAIFRTDCDPGKIARYLEARRVRASGAAIDAYVRRFGATYTDIDLILERFPGPSFDAALASFTRRCRLERSRG